MPTRSRLTQEVPRDGGTGLRAALRIFLFTSAVLLAHPAKGVTLSPEPSPLSLYGVPGLIDTPSARFMDDGEIAITGEAKKPDDRITIAFQALPWLELSARYSKIDDFYGRKDTLYDRSLGLKIKLTNEGTYLPSLAVGALDVGGTLVFGGEYFVASKRFGPFDTSLGLGFGRLGSRGMFENPFSLISDKFDTRPTFNHTGTPAIKDLFRGRDSSLFGGISYDTPIRGLQLLVEYSGDTYVQEQARDLFKIKSQINAGLSYRPIRNVELGAYWTYGNALALRISVRENLDTGDQWRKLDPPPVPIHVRTQDEILNGRIASAVDIGGKPAPPQNRSSKKLPSRADYLSNEPDWSTGERFPDFRTLVLEAKAEGPDPRMANALPLARIREQLASLDITLMGFGIDDTQAIISVQPKTGQGPLPCEVMWQQVPVNDLSGISAVTFVNSVGGREVNRCTKLLEPTTRASNSIVPSGRDARPNAADEPTTAIASNDEDTKALSDRIKKVLAYQGLSLEAFKLNGSEAIVYLNNVSYQRVGRALGRAARALTQLLPPKVEMITIIETNGAITGDQFNIPRTELERVATSGASSEEVLAASTVGPAKPQIVTGADYKRRRTFRFSPILAPAFRQSLFDPDNPFRYQFLIRAGGALQVFRGLSLEGVYDINLYNDFGSITRVSDSQLPHVRSDFRNYLQQGASGIESLQLTLLHQFAPAWTTRLSAGYLEQMYGGVAGEILYAPFRQRWAIGLDVAAVKQRDFDEAFGLRHYSTVTGHLELYYQTPYHGIDLHLLYGRYLARDWGTTIEVSRRFSNGAEVSAYATFTNVPFSKFGEGSFDKGIKITIPFDLYSLFSSRQATTMELKPLTRDGGAILNDGPKLYPIVRSLSYGEAYRTFDEFLDN